MRWSTLASLAVASVMADQALSQTPLIGFTGAGEMIEIDTATGEGTLIADLGMLIVGATNTGARSVWALRDDGVIVGINSITGDWGVVMDPGGLPVGAVPVGIDLQVEWIFPVWTPRLYVLVRLLSGDNELYRVGMAGEQYELVGACRVDGLVDLNYFTTVTAEGTTYYIDYRSGIAGSLKAYPDIDEVGCIASGWGGPYVAGSKLWMLDPYYPPASQLIGPTGFSSLRGMAQLPPRELCLWYADCDDNLHGPPLDLFDFLCWQNRFVNADPYACDCDVSTGFGVCDLFDFLCYQDAFMRAWNGC